MIKRRSFSDTFKATLAFEALCENQIAQEIAAMGPKGTLFKNTNAKVGKITNGQPMFGIIADWMRIAFAPRSGLGHT